MPFEFVSGVNAVARQQQIWGNMIGSAGIAILLFAVWRHKGFVLVLVGVALIATGAYYLYRARLLTESGGDWHITVSQDVIHWQSPNQQVDPTFTANIADIDFIDEGSRSTSSDNKARYHLVFKDQSAIRLREISGINMAEFIDVLKQEGLEVRQTGRFYKPVELRNK